jgi:hypothetical protein
MLVRSGIPLIKYWFSITDDAQASRFLGRIHDPLKQWKLSPRQNLLERLASVREVLDMHGACSRLVLSS